MSEKKLETREEEALRFSETDIVAAAMDADFKIVEIEPVPPDDSDVLELDIGTSLAAPASEVIDLSEPVDISLAPPAAVAPKSIPPARVLSVPRPPPARGFFEGPTKFAGLTPAAEAPSPGAPPREKPRAPKAGQISVRPETPPLGPEGLAAYWKEQAARTGLDHLARLERDWAALSVAAKEAEDCLDPTEMEQAAAYFVPTKTGEPATPLAPERLRHLQQCEHCRLSLQAGYLPSEKVKDLALRMRRLAEEQPAAPSTADEAEKKAPGRDWTFPAVALGVAAAIGVAALTFFGLKR